MNQKLINRKTGEIVQEHVQAGYDHGYYMTLFDLKKLTIVKKDERGFEKYYGGKYQLIEESEKDDEYCSCCGRKLKKSDVLKPDNPVNIILGQIYEHSGRDYWTVEFYNDFEDKKTKPKNRKPK